MPALFWFQKNSIPFDPRMFSYRQKNPASDRPAAKWQALHAKLKQAILSQKLQPGTKLPEDELSEIYGVSRTIVRAALQALAHDRIVMLEPNRGAFVAKPSRQEARDVFEARALVEPHVAGLAALSSNPQQVALLRSHMENEHKAMQEGRDSDAVLLSAQFHVEIARISAQPILEGIVRDLVSRSSLIVALYWRRHDTICESHAHHALVDAIERHQADNASKLMKSHMVDLLSGLDLSERDMSSVRLAELLA